MAVRELRPPLPPLAHDLGLAPERARLLLGEALTLNRAHGHENVNVKVQAVVFVWPVDRPVRDKAFSCKVLSDKIPHQKNLLGGR